MSDLEIIWQNKTNETLLEAGKNLHLYSTEATAVIIEEHRRRGLAIPDAPLIQQKSEQPAATRIIITGVDMPYRTMAGLIFKWTLATIPTALFWFVVIELLTKIK